MSNRSCDYFRRCVCGFGVRRVPGGFTLIELLLVIVLMATLTGTLVVSLAGRQGSKVLEYAAQDMAAAMHFASVEAAQHGMPHRLMFNENHQSYHIERLVDADTQQYSQVQGVGGRSKRLPPTVRIAAVSTTSGWDTNIPDTLQWQPAGNSEHKVRLVGRNSEAFIIEMSAHTGIVNVYRESNEP